MIQRDVLQKFPDLFGSKKVNGRDVNVEETIATLTRESLGVSAETTQHLERLYVPTKTKKTEFITGTPKEAAAQLNEKLRHDARVL